MRRQLRLASSIQPMPRDRRVRLRARERQVGITMVAASVFGLVLAIANYVI